MLEPWEQGGMKRSKTNDFFRYSWKDIVIIVIFILLMPSQIFDIYIFITAGPLVVTARLEKDHQKARNAASCQEDSIFCFL